MAPTSPAPHRHLYPAQPTLAPCSAQAAGITSRLPVPPPNPGPSNRRPAHIPTPAEAYATAHTRNKTHTKPIIEWITRKLGASRRATISDITQIPPRPRCQPQPYQHDTPLTPIQIFPPARDSFISRTESHSLRSYSMSYATSTRRQANNPYPSLPVPPRRTSMADSYSLAPSMSIYMDRSPSSSTHSLGLGLPRMDQTYTETSFGGGGGGGADENASVRAIPPSHPSSPATSTLLTHFNSTSLLSPMHQPQPAPFRDHSTYSSGSSEIDRRRDSASTKPTTILSIDSGPHVAHIAQAPPVITIPTTPTSPLRSSNLSPAATSPITPNLNRAPRHTLPHPRDNPNPLAPPDANASTLTLASSTFALPHPPPSIRLSTPIPRAGSIGLATSPSVTFAPDTDRDRERGSVSVDGGNSQHAMSIVSRGGGRGLDGDASVRAVRRKGSWESYESGWSWRAGRGVGGVEGGPSGIVQHRAGLTPALGGMGGNCGVEGEEGMGGQSQTMDSFWTARSRNEEDGAQASSRPSTIDRRRFSLEASIPIIAG